MNLKIVSTAFVMLLMATSLPLPTASAQGYGVCDGLTRCAGAVASVGGGCAVMVGALLGQTATFEVCANSAVAAAGAMAVLLPYGLVVAEADATGPAGGLQSDNCLLYDTHVTASPDFNTFITCAAAAGSIGDCVAASAEASAKNVLGPLATPLASAEANDCPEKLDALEICRPVPSCILDITRSATPQSSPMLSTLPADVQQEIRDEILEAVRMDLQVDLLPLGTSEHADALRALLDQQITALISTLDGPVAVREIPAV